MMVNLPELIIILVIIFLTVGLGKLTTISQAVAKIHKQYRKGLAQESVDITPVVASASDGIKASTRPKPGQYESMVDDAELEEIKMP